MFRDDRKFNRLAYDRAAQVCFDYSMLLERKNMKEKSKNSIEKADDELTKAKIPAGDDDAGETLNKEARQKLRPVNKEIGQQMDWFPRERKEIISRNLPLEVYGLQYSVSTKAIKLCHNLSLTIEIKMFSPANIRMSASNQRQKAFREVSLKKTILMD